MAIGRQYTSPLTNVLAWSRRKDKTDTVLKLTFLTMQLADFILTALAARYGWSELNPIMQGSLDSLSKLAIFKFAVPVAISWFVPGRWLIPAILLLCGILGWNIKELISLAMA